MIIRVNRLMTMAVLAGLFASILALSGVASAADTARVRVAHLSPDAPAVDVYADGSKVLSNVPFGTVSDYLTVPAGAHEFKVFPAGADSKGTAAIDAKATLNAGTDYTIAATNVLAKIQGTVLVDDNSAPTAGMAKVRVFHASPDAPAIDVAVKGGNVVVSNLSFPKASSYIQVPAGTYNFEVRPTGTTTVALPVNGVQLEAGKTYTVIAEGLLSGTPALKAALQVDATATTSSAPSGVPNTGFGGAVANTSSINIGLVVAMVVLVCAGLGLAGMNLRRSSSK